MEPDDRNNDGHIIHLNARLLNCRGAAEGGLQCRRGLGAAAGGHCATPQHRSLLRAPCLQWPLPRVPDGLHHHPGAGHSLHTTSFHALQRCAGSCRSHDTNQVLHLYASARSGRVLPEPDVSRLLAAPCWLPETCAHRSAAPALQHDVPLETRTAPPVRYPEWRFGGQSSSVSIRISLS